MLVSAQAGLSPFLSFLRMGDYAPYRLAAPGTSPNGGSMREEQAPPLRGNGDKELLRHGSL